MKVTVVLAVLLVASLAFAADQSLAGKVICLDPGHPSENGWGAQGKTIGETHANWLVAQKLKVLLQGMGARVVVTKTTERQYLTNRQRAEIGNAAPANLTVRLHCDSEGPAGLAVYYPDRQGKTPDGHRGPSAPVIAASGRIAKVLYPALIKHLAGKVKGRGLHVDAEAYVGDRQGALTGSIFSTVPVVVIEMVTLCNQSDDAFIASESGRAMMAKAIASALAAALK